MHRAYIGIGGNEGKIEASFNRACSMITSSVGLILKKSSLFESMPLTLPGSAQQPNYLNAAILIETNLSAHELLDALHAIENMSGRKAHGRWESRPLDLDILFYDNEIIETDSLSIPHREIESRDFVLMPLLELDSTLIHPKLNVSLSELLVKLPNEKRLVFSSRAW